ALRRGRSRHRTAGRPPPRAAPASLLLRPERGQHLDRSGETRAAAPQRRPAVCSLSRPVRPRSPASAGQRKPPARRAAASGLERPVRLRSPRKLGRRRDPQPAGPVAPPPAAPRPPGAPGPAGGGGAGRAGPAPLVTGGLTSGTESRWAWRAGAHWSVYATTAATASTTPATGQIQDARRRSAPP